MDGDLRVRKQVTLTQLKALLEFLKDHQELARGLCRGRRGKLHTLKQWNLCAKKLNVYKDGAMKDGKAWSKYWCDWKYRVKRKALELKAARENNRPPSDGMTPLSSMEENILTIIGEGAIENVIIKVDPLLGEDSDEIQPENGTATTANQCYVPESDTVRPGEERKRRHSSAELSDVDDSDGPSSPVVHKSRTSSIPKHKSEDETAIFLRLERKKIENDRKLYTTVRALTTQVTKLTEVMSHIRDVLVNKI